MFKVVDFRLNKFFRAHIQIGPFPRQKQPKIQGNIEGYIEESVLGKNETLWSQTIKYSIIFSLVKVWDVVAWLGGANNWNIEFQLVIAYFYKKK